VGPPRIRHNLKTSKKIEGAINGQFRDTGNIGHTRHRTKKTHNKENKKYEQHEPHQKLGVKPG